MHKLNPRTAALLSAFGWAVGYLLLGRGQAILLQAVLFALQHGSAAAMAYALGCGLVLGWLADRTGHLWPGMLLHSVNNLLVLAMG